MSIISSLEESYTNQEDKYFFDTNIWIYIHYATINAQNRQNQKKQQVYSEKYKAIIEVGGSIFIHNTTIMEIIQVILGDHFKRFKIKHKFCDADYKKDFRSTKDFFIAKDKAFRIIEEILKDCSLINLNLDKGEEVLNLVEIFKESQESDINDIIYLEACYQNDLTFVSDDIDCFDYKKEVTVLTANEKLLIKNYKGYKNEMF